MPHWAAARYLSANRIDVLPSGLGSVIVDGTLFLDFNHMKQLPKSFGDMKVGSLHLAGCSVLKLPDEMANAEINGDLVLVGNPLRTVPETFKNSKITGSVVLDKRQTKKFGAHAFGSTKVVTTAAEDLDKAYQQRND